MQITSLDQLKSLKDGDTATFVAKEWRNAKIVVQAHTNLTLAAEKGAIFTGTSQLSISQCSGVNVNDFHFQDGDLSKYGSDSAVMLVDHSPNTKITNSSVKNYNPAKPSRENEFKYIFFLSSPNSTVEKCQFAEKHNGGAGAIAVNCDPGKPDNITIRRCLFKNMNPASAATDANGYESIRIGDSARSQDASNSLVEECVFINCGSDGEPEVVSLKRHNITVRRCALYNCKGGLTSRHGGDNKFVENYVINGLIGIRLIGPNCLAERNYIDVPDGSGFRGPIVVVKGMPNSPLNGYFPADNAVIRNNTLVKGRVKITDGGKSELTIEPKNVQIIPGKSPYELGTLKPLTEADLTGSDVPDLTTIIGQPSLSLVADMVSNVPITVTNSGSVPTTGTITTSLTLPAGTSAPASFTSSPWNCTTSGQTVTCTQPGPLAAGASSTLQVPVTPNASTIGTTPGPFTGTSSTPGETNSDNNRATMTPTIPVASGVAPDPLQEILDKLNTMTLGVEALSNHLGAPKLSTHTLPSSTELSPDMMEGLKPRTVGQNNGTAQEILAKLGIVTNEVHLLSHHLGVG